MAKVDEVNKKFDSKIIGLHLNSIHIDGGILAKKLFYNSKSQKACIINDVKAKFFNN